MARPQRRCPLIGRNRTPFETLERRQLMCAAHAATFQWTIPNDPMSLASERLRISSLDDIPAPASFAALTAPAATGDSGGLPILNSNPGASVDVYLDFDGDNGGGVNQMVTPYDTNGDPSTFDAAESAVVTQSWQLVSTYFAMFDVNVTTGTPTKPFAWCAIGNNVTGGYSYVGVFPQTLGGTPESYTASSFAQNRASGIAHEVGHNFGLQHQAEFDALGKLSAEYTTGYDVQHGAFMGVDYAQRVHKWFTGHPSNNVLDLQDDMATIASRIGAISGQDGYRTDDFGGTIGTAASMASAGVNQTRAGVLERLDDADLFAFTSAGGRYLASATRDVESGADIKLEILDGSNHLIASEDLPDANDADVAVDLSAGTYYARVTSHGGYGDLGKYVLAVSPMQASTAFDSADVGGTLRRAGGASYDSATAAWSLRGSGTDIAGAADQFRYVYEPLRGDGSITARISGLSGGAAFAKAGVMIRESLAAGARMATADLRGDGTAESIRRNATDTSSGAALGGTAAVGSWVRLTRAGNTMTAEQSADGLTWTTIDAYTLAMSGTVYIGLALTSNRDTAVATGTFDHVAVSGDVGPVVYANDGLTAPANLAIGLTPTGDGLTAAWDAVAGAVSYVIERAVDGVAFTTIATQPGTTYTDPTLPGSYRYFYRVRATLGPADAGRSQGSIASCINRPSAPASVTTMSISTSAIILDWRDVVGETGYRIERSRNNFASFTVIDEVPANVTGYFDTGAASTVYQYRIVPTSELGDGAASAIATEGTRIAVVGNFHARPSTTGSITLSWDDVNKSETGYRLERSVDKGVTFTLLANLGGDDTGYMDTGLASFATYRYRLTATNGFTEGISGAITLATTQAGASQALPGGWGNIDVGAIGAAGASGAGATPGQFTVIGSGLDIGGTADQFQFAYRRLTGDGELIARLDSLDAAFPAGEAGLMFRESLAADGRYAFATVTPAGIGAQFETRTSTGGTATATAATAVATPIWLRLVRSGDLVSGYRSVDGSNWVLMGSATVAMSATIYVGLAVSEHSNSQQATANFSNLSGSAAGQTDTIGPSAPTLNISDDTGASASDGITRDTTLALSGTSEPGATLSITQNGSPIASFVVGYTGAWQFAVPALSDGTYNFAAVASDASGNNSVASVRRVVIDTTPPLVTSATFDRQTGHRWVVQFNDDVGPSLTATDFAIVNRTTSASVTPVLSYDATTRTATLTLAGNALLANGHYELRLAAGAVTDLAGNDSATALATQFDVLSGDLDGDGAVGFADLLIVAKHFNQSGLTYGAGNADYDSAGMVGFADLLIIAKAYGTTLPAAAAPPLVTATARKRTPATFSELTI